jgi:hypothetical protein
MIWIKKDILLFLEDKNESKIFEIKEKREKSIRSIRQNDTFYKLFTEIWKHLWYNKDEMHDILLWWVFGTYDIEIWPIKRQMLNKPETSKLTKEEWTLFITAIIEFCKKHNIPVEITSRELESLYNTYN